VGWGQPEQPAIGTTITLRVQTPVGPIGVVGVLIEADEETWSVRRRDGSISVVNVPSIQAGRVVPPTPAMRASVAEVERMAALGWRSLEVQTLGDWLLRAGQGFTSRANSALALGEPGVPLDAAIELIEQWYAERRLAPRFQIPSDGAPAGLVDALDRREWSMSPTVHVMTGEVGHLLRAATGTTDLELRLDDRPDPAWLSNYRQDGGTLPSSAADLLSNHPAAVFASYRSDGRAVAIARAVVDDRWAGLFAVEVAPDHRRLGLGALVSAAGLRWAAQRGARRAYLQVATDNQPAIGLYQQLGFAVHHDYLYRFRGLPNAC
jgi:ribosomal protein S18 acetylase RimI-like enzyme